jgi:hypothetical protein
MILKRKQSKPKRITLLIVIRMKVLSKLGSAKMVSTLMIKIME